MPDRVGHDGKEIGHDGKEGGHPEWIIFPFHLLAERRHWQRFPIPCKLHAACSRSPVPMPGLHRLRSCDLPD